MHYRKPNRIDRVFNRVVATLTKAGVSFWGSRILEVRGRTSGEPRRVPVNVLTHDGHRYLVAPRGHTQWVRNIRVAGRATLILGRAREDISVTELADDEKQEVLRAYLRRWKWEVGQFFDGVGPDSDPSELTRIAPDHPVFLIGS